MITLQRDGLTMTVLDEVQAAAFEKNGYVRIEPEKAAIPQPMNEPEIELPIEPAPVVEKKRGGRQRKPA